MRGAPERVAARWPRTGLALVLSAALVGVSSPARAQDPGMPYQPAPNSYPPTNYPPPPPAWTPPARPVLVDLRFTPPRAVRDAVLRISPQQPGLPATSERTIYGPTMTLSLPPGSYMLNVTSRRHEANLGLEVKPGMYPIEVALQRRNRNRGGGGDYGDPRRFVDNDRLVAGLGGTAMIMVFGGLATLLVGTVREDRATRRNEALLMEGLVDAAAETPSDPTGLALVEDKYPTAKYHRDLSSGMTLVAAGGAVMMSGLGAALTALPVANKMRKRIAYVELGFGAAFLAGGAAALVFFERDRKAMVAIDDPTLRYTENDRRGLGGKLAAGSLLTGLGVGLIVFPAVALIGDKIRRRRNGSTSFAPYMAPGQAGLALHGRF
jgi:hypothetical protein